MKMIKYLFINTKKTVTNKYKFMKGCNMFTWMSRCLVLIVIQCMLYTPIFAAVRAQRNTKDIIINDEWWYYLDVYNIDGNNYYKLRDIVCIMNGWNVPMSLYYDATTDSISIVKGEQYEIIGTELEATGDNLYAQAEKANTKLYVDGQAIACMSYNIYGNTFFKLRDLSEPLGFDIDFDDVTGLVTLYPRNNGFSLTEYMNEVYGMDFSTQQNKPQFDTVTVGKNLEQALNGVELHPQKTKSAALNQMIEQFMADYFTEDMSTYTKAWVAYEYIVKNMKYGSPDILSISNTPENDALVLGLTHKGVCDHYSAFYAAIMRYVGLDMRLVKGFTHAAAGGYTGHVWTTARIDGLDYVFDPQVEQNIGGTETVTQYRFGKPYSALPDKYQPEEYVEFK